MSMNLNPECELVSESDLRAALRPRQIAAADFEAGIRRRIQAAEAERANDPLANAPQLLRVAAAVLPLQIITGGKVTGSVLPLANASGLYKLVGFVALPAISLFLLLGAAIFGAVRIRRVQAGNVPVDNDQRAMLEAVHLWWRRHKWVAGSFFATTLGLAWFGATSLMLLIYLTSLGAMLYLLSGFARLGLANRRVIGQSVVAGLGLLAQVSSMCTIGMQDIHFVDQMLLPVIFLCGVLVLVPVVSGGETIRVPWSAGQRWWLWALGFAGCLGGLFLWLLQPTLLMLMAVILLGGALLAAAIIYTTLRIPLKEGDWSPTGNQTPRIVVLLLILVPVIAWFTNPIWWPTTPARIRQHVEAFDQAPYSSANWRDWEIVASWAIESGLDPDLSRPRQLLAAEIAGEDSQLPFILGNALRTELMRAEHLDRLKDLEPGRQMLFGNLPNSPITSLTQMDWVIRVLEQRRELSSDQKDLLEQRLLATMNGLAEGRAVVLEEALRVTQLLEVIGRPINCDQYRGKVHDWLREYHCTIGGGFQLPGGFKAYRILTVGSLEQTSYAVDLMRIYGTPDALDLNWVRSYLRPQMLRAHDKYVAAVTLDRLNHLPGVSSPTWLDYMYYERSLIMAALLVALCLHATMSSPAPRSA